MAAAREDFAAAAQAYADYKTQVTAAAAGAEAASPGRCSIRRCARRISRPSGSSQIDRRRLLSRPARRRAQGHSKAAIAVT